jgi:hypothetical protein
MHIHFAALMLFQHILSALQHVIAYAAGCVNPAK